MKRIFLTLLSFILVSCAKPHYVDDLDSKIQGVTGECGIYFKTENLCLTTKWEVLPSESTFGSMLLTFIDKDDPARMISPKNAPFIVLWMTSMGHGSSPVTITLLEDGIYRASDIFFIMPGPWDIRYQLKDGNNVVEEAIQKITI